MITTEVLFEQLQSIQSGAKKLADAVSSTLGPRGQGVVISKKGVLPFITKDGVTVAESVFLEDPLEKIGAEMFKEVARKTVDGAGDGTTTATILANSILNNGIRLITVGANPVDIKAGIDEAVKKVVEYLKSKSQQTKSVEDLYNVAFISTNGDADISKIISECIIAVGKDGVVRVEESNTEKTEVVINKGMNLERGFISHHFVTNSEKQLTEFKDPYILITDKRIQSLAEIIPAMKLASQGEKPLMIICDDIEGEALATLVMNKKQGGFRVCAIRVPYLSGAKNLLLEDIAALTGGKVISEESGQLLTKVEVKDFGRCDELSVSKSTTVIIGGKGEKEVVDDRINMIRNEIESSKDEHETKRLKQRLAKINGGVATIYVGGQTETEVQERKFRVEDAIYATIAAEEEGILPGGGTALLLASKELNKILSTNNKDYDSGIKLLAETIIEPFKTLCQNANKNPEIIRQNIQGSIESLQADEVTIGWNAKTDTYGPMVSMGVVDPTKVVRLALENAASIVGLLLTTKAVIYEKEQKS